MIKEVVNNDNPFSKEIQYIEDNNVLGFKYTGFTAWGLILGRFLAYLIISSIS